MKILFLTEPREDYLQDQMLYGLRQLYGANLIDYPRKEVMYANCERKDLYGKGFTLWRLLPDIAVDRTDITHRIRLGHFDRIIFGSIRRQRPLFWSYLRSGLLIGKSRGRFLFLDGQDGDRSFDSARLFGQYFKREFGRRTSRQVKPISFSIPAAKIRQTPPNKTQQFARHVQCDEAYDLPEVSAHCSQDYLFDCESDYYNDLAQSRFGITMKKGGWDCMRHYEIAANHCVPVFFQLDNKSARCAPHGLVDKENAVSFSNASELDKKLNQIERENTFAELQDRAIAWVKAHSCERVAERLLASRC